jgi:hypothetical protein
MLGSKFSVQMKGLAFWFRADEPVNGAMEMARADKSATPDNVFYASPFGILRNNVQKV